MQNAAEQLTLFGPDSWCGKTSREPSAATAGKTLPPSLKKPSASRSRTRPMCLCLRGGGPGADACTMKWEDGALLGEFTTRSFGASPSAGSESLLSQILEECPHPKYNLSARACVGVLRRAKRRGKELPGILEAALKLQICRELYRRAAERGTEPAPFLVRYAARIRVELTGEPLHTYCLQGNGIGRADTAGCDGRGWREDVSYTLNTVDRPAVMTATASGIQCGNPWDPQAERVFCGDGAWHSLSANSSGGQSRDAILVYDARGNGDGKTVPTITDDHENRITDYPAICIGNGQTNNTGMAERVDTNLVAAVDCRNGTENPTTNGTLQAKTTGGLSLNLNNVVRVRMNVRRLTPLECERLQGYPDGYTDIGEWTDSKGKKRDTSDSNRYKALGNSIALPFWVWLLRRICAQYERTATLGSLFDGIGGFDLAMLYSTGTTKCLRWSSEVEPFCVALLKKRFGDEDTGEDGDVVRFIR